MTLTEASVKLVEIMENQIDSKPTELYLKITTLMCEYGDSCYLEGYGAGCSDSAL
jgi:hypothetical protein